MRRRHPSAPMQLPGRRVLLRPLVAGDYLLWREVRRANAGWLGPWEPARLPGQPDVVEDPQSFSVRCDARQREFQLGTAFGFGIFVGEQLVGEINLSSVQRGAFQSAYVGYWMDHRHAGNGYMPESLVTLARWAFGELRLHRLQIAIIPATTAADGWWTSWTFVARGWPSATSRSTGCGRTTSVTPSPLKSGPSAAINSSQRGCWIPPVPSRPPH